eukprot:9634766-Karenia_brevis.AAC.1
MSTDSRYHNIRDVALPMHEGAYMQNYAQEYLVLRVESAGVQSFSMLAELLRAACRQLALRVPVPDTVRQPAEDAG